MNKRIIQFILTVILMVAFMLSGCGVNPAEKITFANEIVKSTKSYPTVVIGEVTNNNNKNYHFTIKVIFYDKDNKILGTALQGGIEVQSKETKVFEAHSSEDFTKADHYKIQIENVF